MTIGRRVRTLVVDGANVVGTRPDGWWRDRPGAARRLFDQLVVHQSTAPDYDRVLLVLEGAAKPGVPPRADGPVEVVHSPGSGDDRIVEVVRAAVAAGEDVAVATADRNLRERVAAAGAAAVSPGALRTAIEPGPALADPQRADPRRADPPIDRE